LGFYGVALAAGDDGNYSNAALMLSDQYLITQVELLK
jgi:hypothetical protein